MTVTRKVLAVAAGLTMFLGGIASPAAAQSSDIGVNRIWACSVPSGKTYVKRDWVLNQCNPTGYAFLYLVEDPRDGLWACTIPSGWTYSEMIEEKFVCNPFGYQTTYRLRRR
ncbi:hypothetical protein GCM10017673_57470 [Streptosporangium violaceochromogenes]|nr:hypothetical protein GCM10017673_57470 [Streptosporangium violaceochromogenes]